MAETVWHSMPPSDPWRHEADNDRRRNAPLRRRNQRQALHSMVKNRVAIPSAIRQRVLEEFNHRCSICGADRPHIHHLDEDPANNDALNLLPLCPNCHLTDQHSPTANIVPGILKLFRLHKDPVLLSPQFQPLYLRLLFLDDISDDGNVVALERAANELVSFVRALKMGDFYAEQVACLVKGDKVTSGSYSLYTGQPSPETARALAAYPPRYRSQLRAAHDAVIRLCVELLRYQDWPTNPRRRSASRPEQPGS